MVAVEALMLVQAHRAQGRADRSPAWGKDRARQEYLRTCCQTRFENSGANGAKSRIIVVGRACIDHLF
jgi:hypothetical protein